MSGLAEWASLAESFARREELTGITTAQESQKCMAPFSVFLLIVIDMGIYSFVVKPTQYPNTKLVFVDVAYLEYPGFTFDAHKLEEWAMAIVMDFELGLTSADELIDDGMRIRIHKADVGVVLDTIEEPRS